MVQWPVMVSALGLKTDDRWLESCSGPFVYLANTLTCSGLSIKRTGRRIVTDSGTKCAWVVHKSKGVQTHSRNTFTAASRVPQVPDSVKICTTTFCAGLLQ